MKAKIEVKQLQNTVSLFKKLGASSNQFIIEIKNGCISLINPAPSYIKCTFAAVNAYEKGIVALPFTVLQALSSLKEKYVMLSTSKENKNIITLKTSKHMFEFYTIKLDIDVLKSNISEDSLSLPIKDVAKFTKYLNAVKFSSIDTSKDRTCLVNSTKKNLTIAFADTVHCAIYKFEPLTVHFTFTTAFDLLKSCLNSVISRTNIFKSEVLHISSEELSMDIPLLAESDFINQAINLIDQTDNLGQEISLNKEDITDVIKSASLDECSLHFTFGAESIVETEFSTGTYFHKLQAAYKGKELKVNIPNKILADSVSSLESSDVEELKLIFSKDLNYYVLKAIGTWETVCMGVTS